MFHNKFSLFVSYALVSLFGFAAFWYISVQDIGQSMNSALSCVVFYTFLSATFVFYGLYSNHNNTNQTQKSMDILNKDYEAYVKESIDRVEDSIKDNHNYFESEIRDIRSQIDVIVNDNKDYFESEIRDLRSQIDVIVNDNKPSIV